MKKVLIIQTTITKYRIPLFELLGKKYDLTVMHTMKNERDTEYPFKTIYCPTIQQWGYTLFLKPMLILFNQFDVVICQMSEGYINIRILYGFKRKFRLVFWGIGVAAGYNCRYDALDRPAFERMIRKADASIFYSNYPKEKYARKGLTCEKMFVANNTVKVNALKHKTAEYFLFVGALYKEKRIDILLEQYFQAYKEMPSIRNLIIVGGGSEAEYIHTYIEKNNLGNKIIMRGEIFDEDVLAEIFSKAILCISPDQAGLSVLKSMGYGVPFVTHENAITGGEIFNISNNINGVLLSSFDEIKRVLLDASINVEKYIKMGMNAKAHPQRLTRHRHF